MSADPVEKKKRPIRNRDVWLTARQLPKLEDNHKFDTSGVPSAGEVSSQQYDRLHGAPLATRVGLAADPAFSWNSGGKADAG
jgi:hypothetical protein